MCINMIFLSHSRLNGRWREIEPFQPSQCSTPCEDKMLSLPILHIMRAFNGNYWLEFGMFGDLWEDVLRYLLCSSVLSNWPTTQCNPSPQPQIFEWAVNWGAKEHFISQVKLGQRVQQFCLLLAVFLLYAFFFNLSDGHTGCFSFWKQK